jgi:hypothetical protein
VRVAQPGEQVVCVDNKPRPDQPRWTIAFLRQLEIGTVYTVSAVDRSPSGNLMYQLVGIESLPKWGYLTTRFILPEKKIHVTKADRRVSIPIRIKDGVD